MPKNTEFEESLTMTIKKIDTTSPEAQSADLVAGNIEQLKALFPELITEGAGGVAVNVDVLKALVGDEIRRLIRTGEIYQLYTKWFERPVPPKGVVMQMPMSFLLRDSFKFPSEKVGDLVE